jgi:hypothetical protein
MVNDDWTIVGDFGDISWTMIWIDEFGETWIEGSDRPKYSLDDYYVYNRNLIPVYWRTDYSAGYDTLEVKNGRF